MLNDQVLPMTYYSAFKVIEDAIHRNTKDYMIVSEGSATMDIGRGILANDAARQRLDAGTFANMGIGFGFAIAAQALYPKKKIIMVEGYSAFGFSGMELETAIRFGMPLKCIIINNNGVFKGQESIDNEKHTDVPTSALTIDCRYDQMCIAFGGKGAFV